MAGGKFVRGAALCRSRGLYADQSQLAVDDLIHNFGQVVLKLPLWEMRPNLRKIGDVTNVVTDTVGRIVVILKLKPHVRQQVDGFQNGDAVLPSTAEVVDLTATRVGEELRE